MKRILARSLLGHFLVCILFGLAGCAATQKSRTAIVQAKKAGHFSVAQRPTAVQEADSSKRSAVASADSATEKPAIEQTGVIDSRPINSSKMVVTAGEVTQSSVTDTVAESADPANGTAPAYTLSLGGILQLADSQNPNVAVARERITEAYARVERAEALWLPSLRAGLNYNHHEGAIQSVAGDVFQTNRSAFGGGLGAGMYGAASPSVPGLIAQFHLTDAIFQPKIASHQAASRQFGATAARNDVLRDAAVAYLELVRAERGMAIAEEALQNTEKLNDITRNYAETGQGLQADYQRMEAEIAIRREQLAGQQEAIQVASARLAQILHADPSVQITTGEPTVTPLDVMSVEDSAAAYVALGLSRRPELSEQKHLVCEAIERLNREKYAPLIPSVLLGMSYGGMGGGLGTSIVNSNQRLDADAIAYWEIRNLGFGDHAARGEAASVSRQAQMREVAVLDRVAREVVEAYSQVNQRKRRLELAKKGIIAAERSYELNLQRIENVQGLPIEVLQAIQALATARRSYLNAVIDYNISQFELSRATGWFVDEASPRP